VGRPEAKSLLASTPEIGGLIKAEDPEMVVATVNGEPITAGTVTGLAQANKIRMRAQGQPLPDGIDDALMRAALDALVSIELMVQQARAEGITAPDDEIDAEIQSARAQFASEDEYRGFLEDSGLSTEKVRKESERRVLMRAYQSRVVKGQRVDEAMARTVYDENPEMFTEGEQIRASQILIRSMRDDPEAKREEARKRIEEVDQRLKDGDEFGALAKEYSQATTAAKGGDLGFFPRGVMVPMFEEVAFRTPVGEVSPVFETIYGFNIIKVAEKSEPDVKPFAEVKPWLMVEIAREMESSAIDAKLTELREGSEVEILDDNLKEPEMPEGSEGEAVSGMEMEGGEVAVTQ
jgi:peptidyl-prolyl cis-trans isomerase C